MHNVLTIISFAVFAAIALPREPAQAQTPPWFGLTYTDKAISSGPWNAGTTWEGGTAPGQGAVVLIDQGVTVTLNNVSDTRLKQVQIKGTLRLSVNGTLTRLKAETIVVEGSGTLQIGTSQTPGLAEVIFLDNGDVAPTVDDPQAMRRGLLSEGSVLVYGAEVTPHVQLTGHALVGASSFTMVTPPVGWLPNDFVVFPSTLFRQTCGGQGPCIYSEERTVQTVNGTALSISGSLGYNHRVRPTDGVYLSIANLNRSIVFESENAAQVNRRGHIMLMDRCGDVDIRYALFKNLGRTDKREIMNDARWDGNQLVAGSGTNPRSRYPVHFHLCGYTNGVGKVSGSVVWNTPGWGMVNHGSHVEFTNNVVYDFAGAGFVAEDGDEIGEFSGNLAMNGTGIGVFDLDRVYLGGHDFAATDPRLKEADFAFHGDCFWFQSPIVRVVDNIAAGCQGAGFFYHAPGVRKNVDDNKIEPVPFDRSLAENELTSQQLHTDLRYWQLVAGTPPNPDDLLAVELPINSFDGNVAYGSFIGLKVRYVQNRNNNLYERIDWSDPPAPDPLASRIVAPSGHDDDVYAQYNITNSKFWNNQVGALNTYTVNGRYENVFIGVNPNDVPQPQPDPLEPFNPNQTWMGWAGYRNSAKKMAVTASVRIRAYPACLVTRDSLHTTGIEDVQYLSCGHDYSGVKDYVLFNPP